jgi:4-aminobutyrate aminotransferase
MTTNQTSNLKELLAKDENYLANALYRVFHVVAERGEGPYIYTTDGVKLLDLTCGIGVTQLGHCHPEVTKAAKDQIDKLMHISCVTHHTENIKLAEKLANILPGDINNTFFCNSGAEAVDGAIKLSRYANPGRPNIVSFRGAFHGRTLGSTAISSSKVLHRKNYDPLLTGVNLVDYPNCYSCPVFKDPASCNLECMDLLTRMFKLNLPPESISAIIIEPISGEGGYIPSPPNALNSRFNYLMELRKICDQYGILLIADEVQSGIARTGKWFGIDNYGVVPDVITMAKGLGSGLPIGAFSSKKKFMSLMPPGSHGSTFGGNPVACAVGSKTLEIMERDNILDYVSKTGTELMKHLSTELKSKAKVRGFGFMIGMDLGTKDIADKVIAECFKENILVLSAGADSNVIRLIPPLNIDKKLLFDATDKIIGIIKKA